MKNVHTDRRTRYTKQVIKLALFELIEERPLEKITVTEICALADINRGTFYKYYFDVQDLFSKLENEYYNEIIETLRIEGSDVITAQYDTILTMIKENGNLTRIILRNGAISEFLKKLISYAKEKTMIFWETNYPELSHDIAEYIYAYAVNGSVGILTTWLENGMITPIEDMCRMIEKINRIDIAEYI